MPGVSHWFVAKLLRKLSICLAQLAQIDRLPPSVRTIDLNGANAALAHGLVELWLHDLWLQGRHLVVEPGKDGVAEEGRQEGRRAGSQEVKNLRAEAMTCRVACTAE